MNSHAAAQRPVAHTRLVAVLAVAIAAMVVTRSAWICDDAFITYRTIDNFVHGHGLRWNVGERVQSFTHPLWLMLLTPVYAVVRSAYFAGLLVSLAVTVAAVGVYAFGVARSWPAILLGVLALVSSRAFVDYSTSGLENPLTHLLLLAFLAVFLRPPDVTTPRRAAVLGLLAGLGALNRLDTILLFAPALAWLALTARRRLATVGAIALGFAPLAAWMAFALFYYGFPLPNTYYAKVATGVSRPLLWTHGIAYLLNAVRVDRLSLLLPLAAVVAALSRRRGAELAVVSGIVLYLVYLVGVGGDFMSGRFLTAPFVMAVGLVGSMDAPWNEPRHPAVAWTAAALLVLGLTAPLPTLLPDPHGYGIERQASLFDPSGVSDERGFYSPATALSAVRVSHLVPLHSWAIQGQEDGRRGTRVSVQGSVGFYGFFAGPRVHVVDPMALSDPLLARLPAGSERPRIGHYERRIPAGYLATLESGRNQIADPRLAEFYDRLRLVVSGPLLAPGRLRTIVAMNLGRYDRLIDRAAYRRPPARETTAGSLERYDVPPGGLVVRLNAPSHRARVTVSIAARGQLRATLMRGGAEAAVFPIVETGPHAPARVFSVPLDVAAAGYDGIRVEMIYAFDEPRVADVRTSGPPVLPADEARDLPLDDEGLWIPLPAGARLETLRATTDRGQRLSVRLLATGGADEIAVAGPDDEHPPGSGIHLVDLASSPLAAGADRVWLRPARPGSAVRLRRVEIVTSPLPLP